VLEMFNVNRTQPPNISNRSVDRTRQESLITATIFGLPRPDPLPSLPAYLHIHNRYTGEETWPILSISLCLHSRARQIGSLMRHSRCHLPMEDQAWNILMIDRQSSSIDAAVRFSWLQYSSACYRARNLEGNRYGAA
jgi:hypothetical protein